MSTVDKFTFRGAGGAFPRCLEKIDVSGWAFVEPLTIEQVCKIWWRLETITWMRDAVPTVLDFKTADYETDLNGDSFPEENFRSVGKTPKERVCGTFYLYYSRNFYSDGSTNYPPTWCTIATGTGWPYEIPFLPYALYDGDVEVESNLLGYGWVIDRNVDEFGNDLGGDINEPFAASLVYPPYEEAEGSIYEFESYEILCNASPNAFVQGEFTPAIPNDTVTLGDMTWVRFFMHSTLADGPSGYAYGNVRELTFFDFA